MNSSSSHPATACAERVRPSLLWAAWWLFALLTAALTLHHVMWFDEMQAWLLVRDSPTLAALFHNLHYEGHPSLWYLLLYPLTRISVHPAAMQLLNYVLALAVAALILTALRQRPLQATLIIFSSILFNEYCTFARSYLLASLLLLAAVRLFLADRPRPILAAICLGLAINTHFLTTPIALTIAGWFVFFAEGSVARTFVSRLKSRTTLALAVLLAVSIVACYLTVRPAPDLLPLDVNQPSAFGHFCFVAGRVWRIFFRIPIGHLSPHALTLLDPQFDPSIVATALSALTLLLTLVALRTRPARIFFAVAFVFAVAVLAMVTLTPEIRHYGFIWVAFIAAMLIDAAQPEVSGEARATARVASVTLYLILAQQCLLTLSVGAKEWRQPISGSLQAAQWIHAHGLTENPMLIEPSDGPNALLGYLNKTRVWMPGCHCWGSFAHRAMGIDLARPATPADIAAAGAGSTLPVLVVANFPLDPAAQHELGVQFLFASSPQAIKRTDNFFLYGQIAKP